MADALTQDEFYFSEDDSAIPQDMLHGEDLATDESVEYAEPEAPKAVVGHSIHPDRMMIPTLKRHADEQAALEDKPEAPVKKQKKQRAEEAIPTTPEDQLAYLLKLYAKYKKPTALETDNITSLTAEHIIDTTYLRGNLQSFIQASIPNWEKVLTKQFNKGKGHPRVIVLTTSAVRCIDLVRTDLPHLHRIHTVAKLFAKHKKLADHVEMLSKTVVRIAVGTPQRVLDLQNEESVDLFKACSIVVLDMSKDAKMQNVLTLDDCSKATFDFLDAATPHFKTGLKLMFKY